MGSMTRNNLRENLSWLVSSKPFAPPPPGPAPPASYFSATQDTPIHDSLLVEQQRHATSLPSLTRTAGGGIDHAGKEFEFTRPLHPASSFHTAGGEAMARLQSGPRSNTRRLLSHSSSDPLQTPTPYSSRRPSTSLRDQYAAAYGHGNDSKSCRILHCRIKPKLP